MRFELFLFGAVNAEWIRFPLKALLDLRISRQLSRVFQMHLGLFTGKMFTYLDVPGYPTGKMAKAPLEDHPIGGMEVGPTPSIIGCKMDLEDG